MFPRVVVILEMTDLDAEDHFNFLIRLEDTLDHLISHLLVLPRLHNQKLLKTLQVGYTHI